MNFESVRSIIDTYIKKNGVEAITGDILNNVLNTMLDDVDTAISSIEPSPGGGSGEGGVSEEDVLNILEKNAYATQSWVNEQGFAKISDYYTKAQSDARYLASSLLGSNTLIHSGNVGSYAMRWMGGENVGADVNSFSFAAGAYGVALASNSPTSTGYGAVLNIPYRVGLRNVPDYMGQIYIPNGDDPDRSIFYRTSLAETWQPWRRIISEDDNGNVTLYGTHLFANKYIFMNDGGEGIYLSTDAISWHNAGNGWVRDLMVFAPSGNVGIGTASPGYKLDVNGEVRATTFRFYDDYRSRITLNGSYIDIISAGNEMVIGTHSGDTTMYINYRNSTGGGTAKTYIWNAGSPSSWADFYMGNTTINGNLVVSGDVASA